MSIAAEQVADKQRLRERLRAITLDTKLAVSGFVAIAIRVLDDNFFPPQPRASPLDHRVSGPVPATGAFSVAAARSCLKPMAKKAAQQVTLRLTVGEGGSS